MMQVFISHATHEDGAFANRLASDLERLGVDTWIAPKSIPAGEDWEQAIEQGIQTSPIFLLVITPSSMDSNWVQEEIAQARGLKEAGKCEIIPLHVSPTAQISDFVSSIQFVPFLNDYGRGLIVLGDRLGLDRDAVENVAFYTTPEVPTWLVEPRPPDMVATLENLQKGLDETIPPKKVGENLLIASWNLQAFAGVTNKWESGPGDSPLRDLRSLLFIAEILSRFDVIVLQEVHRNSVAMEQLIAAMNQYHNRWGYMYSEMSHAKREDEQAAVIFDIRRLRPAGFQGQLSAAALDLEEGILEKYLFVPPFAHSFDIRGKLFTLIRLLFDYEMPDTEGLAPILNEIRQWAFAENAAGKSLITVGDFADRNDLITKLMRDSHLMPPAELARTSTKGVHLKYYDEFAWFYNHKEEAVMSLKYTKTAGLFDFSKYIFSDIKKGRQMVWRISDHLPIWIEFSTLDMPSSK